MSKILGTFRSAHWGEVTAIDGTYGGRDIGPLAVQLLTDGELLAILSVNLYKPECSHDSKDLPADCFYVKTWSENAGIAEEARKSGLFIERLDLPRGLSGFIAAPVWQLRGEVTP